MRWPWIVAVMAASAAAAPAGAQEIMVAEAACAEGRVATADSAGRCCWPAQVWSEAYGRCSGPPSCPPGLVAEGDDCVRGAGPTALQTPVVPATPGSRSAWVARDDELEEGLSGVHFFLGLSAGAGLSIVSVNPDPAGLEGDFLAEIILGVTAGRFEWRLELAPASFVPAFSRAGGYSVMTTFGGLVHLGGPVFWPLRAGAGIWGPIDRDDIYLQAQLDLLGLAFRLGNWMVEVNLPSYRFLGEFSDGVYLYVLTGQVAFRYLF